MLAFGVGGDRKLVAPPIKEILRKEVSLHNVEGIRQYVAEIEIGRVNHDLSQPINLALRNFERVIVPKGIYPISEPIVFTHSHQELLFEDNAWFMALNAWTNGIAVPHGCLDCSIKNPGLIGRSSAESDCGSGQHTAILWNSNPMGTAPFGSTLPDDMAGRVEFGRFKGATDLTGWHTAIHSNMARGFAARHCYIRGLIGTSSGHGYGHLFSGSNVTSEGHRIDGYVPLNGRHGIYLGDQCSGSTVRDVHVRNTRKSAIAANTGITDGNSSISISKIVVEQACLDVDTSATNAAVELNYQGDAQEGGVDINIDNIQARSCGNSGIYIRGYRNVNASNINLSEWGKSGGGNYAGIELDRCSKVLISNFYSMTSQCNEGNIFYIRHVVIRRSSNIRLIKGAAVNTGFGEQRAAISIDMTQPRNQRIRIDGFHALRGKGKWTQKAVINYNFGH